MTEAFDRGAEMMQKVYAGEAAVMPEGTMAFTDVMTRTLFAEVWTRDTLSMRDKRLLLLGVIAATGADDVFGIQSRAALANGELTPDELRETLVLLAPYAGYPRVSSLIGVVEKAIHTMAKRAAAAAADAPDDAPEDADGG